MQFSRKVALKVHYFFDQILPPFIRDAGFINHLLFRLVFREHAATFLEFKEKAVTMTSREICELYKQLPDSFDRETDLTQNCVDAILSEVVGETVLEVGCGRCYLTKRLCELACNVTALDWSFSGVQSTAYNSIIGSLEQLPLKDQQFDTVICTHTLEHVRNFGVGLSELRRVGKKKLIIVVPKQRPYKYTFDLHLHFFPSPSALLIATSGGNRSICREIDGDLFYVEQFSRRDKALAADSWRSIDRM